MSAAPDVHAAAGYAWDAAWFEENPRRTHRLRPAVGREAELLGLARGQHPGRPIVVVRQLAPGIRMRITLSWSGPIPPDEEAVAHALYEAASDPGRETITADELRQLAAALEVQGALA